MLKAACHGLLRDVAETTLRPRNATQKTKGWKIVEKLPNDEPQKEKGWRSKLHKKVRKKDEGSKTPVERSP